MTDPAQRAESVKTVIVSVSAGHGMSWHGMAYHRLKYPPPSPEPPPTNLESSMSLRERAW